MTIGEQYKSKCDENIAVKAFFSGHMVKQFGPMPAASAGLGCVPTSTFYPVPRDVSSRGRCGWGHSSHRVKLILTAGGAFKMNRTLAMLLTTFMCVTAGSNVDAQNRQQEERDSHKSQDSRPSQEDEVRAESAREGRENDRRGNDPSLNNDQSPRREDDRRADRRVDEWRRAHPHAAARCHDGYFTSTHDRDRACKRHGGIDVWLVD